MAYEIAIWSRTPDSWTHIIEHKSPHKTIIESNGRFFTFNEDEMVWVDKGQILPSENTFESEGIEDLSILDRVEDTCVYEMVNGVILGEGKVFSHTVDLNKYKKLKKLEVK